jgi:hypothetical protein
MATRFNVILEDRQYRFLSDEASRLSVSAAELVRRAIDRTYGLTDEKTDGFELSLGVWRRPDAAAVGRRPGIRFRR